MKLRLKASASVTLSKRWRWAVILYVVHSIASVPLQNGVVGDAAITEHQSRVEGSG